MMLKFCSNNFISYILVLTLLFEEFFSYDITSKHFYYSKKGSIDIYSHFILSIDISSNNICSSNIYLNNILSNIICSNGAPLNT